VSDCRPARRAAGRNIVIFVAMACAIPGHAADRADQRASAARRGFANSHAVYPTLTTANASVIATGHYLGDTGDYANTLYAGFPFPAARTWSSPLWKTTASCAI